MWNRAEKGEERRGEERRTNGKGIDVALLQGDGKAVLDLRWGLVEVDPLVARGVAASEDAEHEDQQKDGSHGACGVSVQDRRATGTGQQTDSSRGNEKWRRETGEKKDKRQAISCFVRRLERRGDDGGPCLTLLPQDFHISSRIFCLVTFSSSSSVSSAFHP